MTKLSEERAFLFASVGEIQIFLKTVKYRKCNPCVLTITQERREQQPSPLFILTNFHMAPWFTLLTHVTVQWLRNLSTHFFLLRNSGPFPLTTKK